MSRYTSKGFEFANEFESHMHRHFMPSVMAHAATLRPKSRILDVGCGNGFLCGEFLKLGHTVVGIDLSVPGIEIARQTYPAARFEVLDADAQILTRLDEQPFDFVVSTEVVEHVYEPREWARGCFSALKAGGIFVCSTPYHGYAKNLAISIFGKWDKHADPLWDGGHIKLWSKRTLTHLLREAGFQNVEFRGAGRIPGFWMTMIAKAEKPANSEVGRIRE